MRSAIPKRANLLKQAASTQAIGAVAQQLVRWIESARYPLHSRLPPERELAGMLLVLRGRLREVLQVLEDRGRIWRRVGMGTFVGARPHFVRSRPEAAQRREETEIAMVERYAANGAKATNWEQWERWDDLLHRSIAEACGNGLLISIVDQLFRIKMHPRWRVRQASVFDRALIERYASEHRAVIAQLIGRDAEGAEAAMRRRMLGLSLIPV